jgi:hypothetical protein
VAKIKSLRAKKLLDHLRFFKKEHDPSMKRYPGDQVVLWVKLEWESHNVKNLSFFGELEDYQKVILESMASLLINRPMIKLEELSIRECEAYLRDKNAEASIEEMSETEEKELKKVFQWICAYPKLIPPKEYSFSSEKGPFRQLKLVDKIREIKAFLNSPEILTLYQHLTSPELVDVEDLTIYIHVSYDSQSEKDLFEKLHLMGVEMFGDENLNFIPESL